MPTITYDPILKLELLKAYMDRRVASLPGCYISFQSWVESQQAKTIYGSPQYFRSAATHCFYCELPFKEDSWSSIDHFFPQSKDATKSPYKDIYVICCSHCNVSKGCMKPDRFRDMVTRASIKGKKINGFTDKDLTKISANVNRIFDEVRLGVKTNVYWRTKTPNRLPKGFIRY
jgi:hypothetical protein